MMEDNHDMMISWKVDVIGSAWTHIFQIHIQLCTHNTTSNLKVSLVN